MVSTCYVVVRPVGWEKGREANSNSLEEEEDEDEEEEETNPKLAIFVEQYSRDPHR